MNLPVLSNKEIAKRDKTTIYQKGIKAPSLTVIGKRTGLRVLKFAVDNAKISAGSEKRISKGPTGFRDKKLYTLTLVERETCPEDCSRWSDCYGNSTPFGWRYKNDGNLEAALEADLHDLQKRHPEGFVVRLHVLGDFATVTYVSFWWRMLKQIKELSVYGYTHWKFGTPIGNAVSAMVLDNPGRCAIMRSDKEDERDPLPGAYVGGDKGIPCPQQTGKTKSCLTCGLCMNGRTEISFSLHGGITL